MTEQATTLGRSDVVVPRLGVGVMTWGDPSGRAGWTPAKLAYGGGPESRDEDDLVLPIPGAKNARQAADNGGALALSLNSAETEALDRATAAWRGAKGQAR